ncbi:uncharacterized protein LOC135840977 [Planococcus citri]|uniref:uncharacterized protein LOC135840977 n=1 Tax=Planococcus citri TaxID=170843 RepID=UPI0031F89B8A
MIKSMYSENKLSEGIKSAIVSGRLEVVEKLLNRVDKWKARCQLDGCDCSNVNHLLNEVGPDGETLLGLATKLNKCEIVKYLLSKGASPNAMNKQSLTAYNLVPSDAMKQLYIDELFWAVCKNNLKKVQELLLSGLPINCTENDDTENTLLHVAARYSNKNTVMYLLRCGAEIDALNSCGATPLHEALCYSNAEVAEVLINYGANLNIRPHMGKFAEKSIAELLSEPHVEKLFNKNESEPKNELPPIPSPSTTKTPEQQLARSNTPAKASPPMEEIIKKLKHWKVSSDNTKSFVQRKLNLLWPRPQKIDELLGSPFIFSEDLFISVRTSSVSFHRILDIWNLFRDSFASLEINVVLKDIHPNSVPCNDSLLECNINRDLFSGDDCYQIHVASDKILIQCGGLTGLYYALSTFTQLLKINNSLSLSPILIQDYPQLSHRAVLLDISNESKVPIMDRLLDIVDTLSVLKINYIHIYARFSSSSTWDHSYKQSEIVYLDRYTQDRFVNLVPVLEIESQITDEILLKMWPIFQKFLSSFSNLRYVHIGPYLSMRLVKNIDSDPLIHEIYHLLNINPSITLLLCTNELNHCKVVPKLTNFLLINYDFQNGNSFFDSIEAYNKNGFLSMFCTGTSAWNCLAGCPEVCLFNIFQGIRAARKVNSIGVVVANWPGLYLITPVAFAWPGFLIASGFSWNSDINLDDFSSTLSSLLDMHVFEANNKDQGVGHVITGLGYLECEALRMNDLNFNMNPSVPPCGSIFYQLLTDISHVNFNNFMSNFFENTIKTLKKTQDYLSQVSLKSATSDQVITELSNTVELLLCACKIGQGLYVINSTSNRNVEIVSSRSIIHLPSVLKSDLIDRLHSIRDIYSELWYQQNLPSGLHKSLNFFTNILQKLSAEGQTNKV